MRITLLTVLCAGCFELPGELPCGEDVACPTGTRCAAGVCVAADPDAAQADARPDSAPPADMGADPDLRVTPDMRVTPDAAVVVDGGPDADAQPTPDARVQPDAGPDAAPCPSDEELPCNGLDDDCDGETDEVLHPRLCELCDTELDGACGPGAMVCHDGELRCGRRLAARAEITCNLLDDDCDEVVDEAGEVPPDPRPEDLEVAAQCAELVPLADRLGAACEDPAVVGCDDSHACVDPACMAGCLAGPSVLECLAGCARLAEDATRWRCAGGDGGPVCTADDCPEGFHADGPSCARNREICNNGLDDDADGIVDGTTLEVPDPCAVAFDTDGAVLPMGLCRNADDGPGCEDSERLRGDDEHNLGTCSRGDCPRRVQLDYAYALDREEVSMRAYHACVEAGCCLPPEGRLWALAAEVLAADAPQADRDRCAPAITGTDAADRALLPDLPVAGVTWCQARDYCNWATKRLPTEFEWGHASTGTGERREFPWGDGGAPECPDFQCCGAFEGAEDGLCDGGVPVCLAEIPADRDTRISCAAHYGAGPIREECPVVQGPTPVWGNADDRTPEGILNLGGNVSEWVFDWENGLRGGIYPNSAGSACDGGVPGHERVVRGSSYAFAASQARNASRAGLIDSVRLPNIGFRCARTVQPAGLCDTRMPDVPPECRPGAHHERRPDGHGLPACDDGPDFVNAPEDDRGECDEFNGLRENSGECTRGLTTYCASDAPVGCEGFVVSSASLPEALRGLGNEGGLLLQTIFDASLAPQGGTTIVALDVDPGFPDFGISYDAAFGTAAVNGRRELAWLGEGPGCPPLERSSDFQLRVPAGGRSITPVCYAEGGANIAVQSAPVRLYFSWFSMTARYFPARDELEGDLNLFMLLGDEDLTAVGEARGAQAGLAGLGVVDVDLCVFANLPPTLPECRTPDAPFAGCVDGECTDPDTCRGFVLPVGFTAVRAHRANISGLDCPPPEE